MADAKDSEDRFGGEWPPDIGVDPYYCDKWRVIYKGDCRDILPLFSDKSVDLALTDPPYGIGVKYDSYVDTENAWFSLMSTCIPHILRVSRMTILPSCQIRRLKWIYDNFPPDWLLCWYKGSTGHASFLGFNDWEPHLVYGKTKKQLYMHDYFQTKSSPKRGTNGHPCPKPDAWAEWIIRRASAEGDLVCDPFLGSGVVAVVAGQLNRRAIGIEISEEYCEIAANRCAADTIARIQRGEY